MTPAQLGELITIYLNAKGYRGTKTLAPIDVDLLLPGTGAKLGILCAGASVLDMYRYDNYLSGISCGSGEVFALPYSRRLILIFDTRHQE
jgi:hypothetical protein